jgi:hypothetical protein
MSDSRIRLSAAVLLAALLLTTPVLAGCAPSIPALGGSVTGDDADSGDADAAADGAEVPADFPAEIPLIDGEVLSGVSLGSEGAQVWSVLIAVDDGSAFDEITRQLEGVGFVASGLGGTTELGSTGTFSKDPYDISVAVSGGSDAGWAAKYTVSEQPS